MAAFCSQQRLQAAAPQSLRLSTDHAPTPPGTTATAAHTSGVHLATTVSTYIADNFWAGDHAAMASRDPRKNASFRALADHPDLQMAASTLSRLVQIGQQARHLPADLSEQLSLSHHRALLTVPNSLHKQHLARLAVEGNWPVHKLAEHIAAEHPKPPSHAGRPHKPAVLKWLGGLTRAAGQGLDVRAVALDLAKLIALIPSREPRYRWMIVFCTAAAWPRNGTTIRRFSGKVRTIIAERAPSSRAASTAAHSTVSGRGPSMTNHGP